MDWLLRISPFLRLFWAGRWPCGAIESLRILKDHELVIVTQGACIITIENALYECSRNSFIIVPPGIAHATKVISDEPVMRHCFHFDWVYDRDVGEGPIWWYRKDDIEKRELHIAPAFVPRMLLTGSAPADPAFYSVLAEITRRWATGSIHLRISCRALLLDLLTQLLSPTQLTHDVAPRGAMALALEVQHRLDSGIAPGDSVRNTLRSLGYSYEHLCRVFRSTFALTPVEYLNRNRIERAKALLMDRSLTISDIAAQLGFTHPSYFTRLFRTQTGMSPRRFTEAGLPRTVNV